MQLERNGKKEDETKVTVNLCKLKSSSNPNIIFKVLLDIILSTFKLPSNCPYKKGLSLKLDSVKLSTDLFPKIFLKDLTIIFYAQWKMKVENKWIVGVNFKLIIKIIN